MSDTATCSGASREAGESLAGTAPVGSSWLLVEVRAAWGRNAVADTALPPVAREVMEAFSGNVLLLRRPDRRRGAMVISATASEEGGTAVGHEFGTLDAFATERPEDAQPLSVPIFLVCAHGRRDACCARYGPPLFEALAPHLSAPQLWQSSHQGGHRFAPNVLVLPYGVQLARIPPERAGDVVELLGQGRIPLDLYRGRTIYAAPVQAVDIAIRLAGGFNAVGDLRLLEHEEERVTFATPTGDVTARVEKRLGAPLPASCGAEPEPAVGWVVSLG